MASTTAAFRRLAYQAARGNLHQTALSAGFTAGSAQQPTEAWGDVHPHAGATQGGQQSANFPAKLSSSLLGLNGPAHTTQGLSLLQLGAASLQPPTLQQLTSQQATHLGAEAEEQQQQQHVYQHLHQFQHQQGLRVILPSAAPKTFTAGLPIYAKRDVGHSSMSALTSDAPGAAVSVDAVSGTQGQSGAGVGDLQAQIHAPEQPSISEAVQPPHRQSAAAVHQQQTAYDTPPATDAISTHGSHTAVAGGQQPPSLPAGAAHPWEHQGHHHQYQHQQTQFNQSHHHHQQQQHGAVSTANKYTAPAPSQAPVGSTATGQHQQVPPRVAVGAAEGLGSRKRTRGSVASIALNKEIMGASSVDDLLYLVRARGAVFDFFNISSAIARLPKLVTGEVGFMGPTAQRNNRFGGHPQFSRHGTSSIAGAPVDVTGGSAGAGAGASPHLTPAVKELAERLCTALVLRFLPELDARGVANTAWAFAKLRYVPDPALPALLSREALMRMPEFEPQHLSNLAWALVYMHHKDDALLSEIAHRSAARLTEFKPQEVANVMWALASLDHLDAYTAGALGSRAGRLAPLLKEQELSNIVWSLGRAHHHDPALLTPLLSEMRTKLHLFMPQGVSNVIWALGTLGHRDEGLLRAVASRFSTPSALRHFDAQALANLAWGLAALGRTDPQLMWAVACEASTRVASMSPGSLSSLAWACAVAGIRHEGLITALGTEAIARLHAFEPTPLAQVTWALAVLAPSEPTLLPGLGAACAARADRLPGQALLQLAQACAVSPQLPSDLVNTLAARVARGPSSGVTSEEAGAISAALQQAMQVRHIKQVTLKSSEDKLSDTACSSQLPRTQACSTEAHSQPGAASTLTHSRMSVAGVAHRAPQAPVRTSSGSTSAAASGAAPPALTHSLWSFAGGLGNGVLGTIWAAHNHAVPSSSAASGSALSAGGPAALPGAPQMWDSGVGRTGHHPSHADLDDQDVSSSVDMSAAYQLPSDLYLP